MMEWFVNVVEHETERVVRSIRCKSEREAERVERGVQINCNLDYYYTEIVSALPEKPPSTEIDVPSEPTSSALGNSDNDHTAGRVPAEPGSREPSPSVSSACGGFDPSRWPQRGDKVRFLGKNGYPVQLGRALTKFTPGQELTVQACTVGRWDHSLMLHGHAGWHNGVMFERVSDGSPEGVETQAPSRKLEMPTVRRKGR